MLRRGCSDLQGAQYIGHLLEVVLYSNIEKISIKQDGREDAKRINGVLRITSKDNSLEETYC